MFRYNRFWHFWFQFNNRNYLKISLLSLAIFMLLIPAAVFFPPLWGIVIVFPLIIGGAVTLFTELSNFFYTRQNQRLLTLKTETFDEILKEDIDLYVNRRIVCPQELLSGTHLNLPHDTLQMESATANTPLIFEAEDILNIDNVSHNTYRRNPAIKAVSQSNQLYIKTVTANDGLSEIAAREMAEITGFKGLIPSSTIAKTNLLPNHEDNPSIPNNGLVLSQQKIKELIDRRNEELPEQSIKNSLKVQNAVATFIVNLKTAAYRTNAQKNKQLKLLHIQKFMPNAFDGLQLYEKLFNESIILPGQVLSNTLVDVKNIIQTISLPSFQENFLLHLILGSQDANPGNTLFTNMSDNITVLHSIDHERIMPEDNYNITKKIPLSNGSDCATIIEKDIKNVFPIRLWLAGLPQADVPFTKQLVEKTLASLNPGRLLAYHRHKKLFSPAAVGAQLDRVLLIKKVFDEEIKKSQITLTPKQLFLKLINNHPTYLFLKEELQLSDFHTFSLLGQVPEGADMSFLRHPLQWFPMVGMAFEAELNEEKKLPSFSEKSFNSSHAHHVMFFSMATLAKRSETSNKAGLDILTEISNQYRLH